MLLPVVHSGQVPVHIVRIFARIVLGVGATPGGIFFVANSRQTSRASLQYGCAGKPDAKRTLEKNWRKSPLVMRRTYQSKVARFVFVGLIMYTYT